MPTEEEKQKQREYHREWRKKNPFNAKAIERRRAESNPEKNKERNAKKWEGFLTPEQRRERSIKRKYGITSVEYNDMFAAQGNCCATCKATEGKWVVDHCHNTNKVRGILCTPCNLALGHVKDNVDTLRAMITYLEGDW